jgi:Glucose-6-phosphate dehydrogenase, NAD binding domain
MSLRNKKGRLWLVTAWPVEQSGKDKRVSESCMFVAFRASGDLTKRKLLPALLRLRQAELLPEEFAVVEWPAGISPQTFVPEMKEGIVFPIIRRDHCGL